jgi:hypothetical protein
VPGAGGLVYGVEDSRLEQKHRRRAVESGSGRRLRAAKPGARGQIPELRVIYDNAVFHPQPTFQFPKRAKTTVLVAAM